MRQRLLTRKEFLREAFTLFRRGNSAENGNAQEQSRYLPGGTLFPPGSGNATEFINACTQCYQCVSACPHESIRVYRDEKSDIFGYPVIQPRLQPCYECPDLPCIANCQDGTLIAGDEGIFLGIAAIDEQKCLAFSGQFCMSCINACPYSGKAIVLNVGGKPQIRQKFCTGCGLCEFSCPTDPAAIQIYSNSTKGE